MYAVLFLLGSRDNHSLMIVFSLICWHMWFILTKNFQPSLTCSLLCDDNFSWSPQSNSISMVQLLLSRTLAVRYYLVPLFWCLKTIMLCQILVLSTLYLIFPSPVVPAADLWPKNSYCWAFCKNRCCWCKHCEACCKSLHLWSGTVLPTHNLSSCRIFSIFMLHSLRCNTLFVENIYIMLFLW
jgi:hypothetical protein